MKIIKDRKMAILAVLVAILIVFTVFTIFRYEKYIREITLINKCREICGNYTAIFTKDMCYCNVGGKLVKPDSWSR